MVLKCSLTAVYTEEGGKKMEDAAPLPQPCKHTSGSCFQAGISATCIISVTAQQFIHIVASL